uniref:Uncharacterized protein n=1 Tax=Ascaris lumbricoides TaxID=6252 RepID=A0A0M3HI99_ASCLU
MSLNSIFNSRILICVKIAIMLATLRYHHLYAIRKGVQRRIRIDFID